MQRINTGNGLFSDGTAAAGYLDGTVVTAKWLNDIQEELCNVLAILGIQLDGAKQTQLATTLLQLLQKRPSTYASDTGAANVYKGIYTPPITEFQDGMRLTLGNIKLANGGASTFAPNELAAKPIWGENLQALQGNEMFAGGNADLEFQAALNAGAGAWVLRGCTGGALQVAAATKGKHAVNLDAGDARYAALAGLATQVFNVATPTSGGHAVNLNEFFCSLTQNGCVKIPVIAGGAKRTLIIQWGQANAVPAAGGVNVTFPLAFPTAFLMGIAGFVNSGGISAAVSGGWGNPTSTGMTVFNNGNGGASAISWIAIGY
ncbi:hypothetical protein [Cupriavidus pauculus]|uniref:gp53-like domain-containing protein n=1 Tax=Cupriavidus pauculus TaxID=82633 RepID=UPI0038578567